LAHEVFDPTRGGHHNLYAIAKSLNLTGLGHSAINGGDTQVHRLSQGAHHISDLGCQFPGGGKDETERAPWASATAGEFASKSCDHRDAKGEGLARACLTATQHVFARKGVRQSVDLNGEGLVNTHAGKGSADVGGHAKC
jgi:hypothetical protein